MSTVFKTTFPEIKLISSRLLKCCKFYYLLHREKLKKNYIGKEFNSKLASKIITVDYSYSYIRL